MIRARLKGVLLLCSVYLFLCGSAHGKTSSFGAVRKLVERHLVSKVTGVPQKGVKLKGGLQQTVMAGVLAVGIGCTSLGMSGCGTSTTIRTYQPTVRTQAESNWSQFWRDRLVMRESVKFRRIKYGGYPFGFYNRKYENSGYLIVLGEDSNLYEINKGMMDSPDYDGVFVYYWEDGLDYIGRAKYPLLEEAELTNEWVEVERPDGSKHRVYVDQIDSVLSFDKQLIVGGGRKLPYVQFAMEDTHVLSHDGDLLVDFAEGSNFVGKVSGRFLNGMKVVSIKFVRNPEGEWFRMGGKLFYGLVHHEDVGDLPYKDPDEWATGITSPFRGAFNDLIR